MAIDMAPAGVDLDDSLMRQVSEHWSEIEEVIVYPAENNKRSVLMLTYGNYPDIMFTFTIDEESGEVETLDSIFESKIWARVEAAMKHKDENPEWIGEAGGGQLVASMLEELVHDGE